MKKISLFIIVSAYLILLFINTGYPQEGLPCLRCHKSKNAGEYIHPALDMDCSVCHTAPHEEEKPTLSLLMDQPDLCYMCHDESIVGKEVKHKPVIDGKCTACHNPHTSNIENLLVAEGTDLCFKCHSKNMFNKKVVHTALEMGDCTLCHTPHSGDNEYLLTESGRGLCFECHDEKNFTNEVVHIPVEIGECTACHSPHSTENDTLLVSTPPGLCYECHDEGEFTRKVVHSPVESGMCTFCHKPHTSTIATLLSDKPWDLCTSCHTDEGDGTHVLKSFGTGDSHPTRGFDDPHRKGEKLSCTSCHLPHSSDLNYLFAAESGTGKIEDLCMQCHKKILVRP